MQLLKAKTIPGWILLIFSGCWEFFGIWARIEFISKKMWPEKSMIPILTAIRSNPFFPIILSIGGLFWIWWFSRPAYARTKVGAQQTIAVPEYYFVDKDGNILNNSGSDKYRLSIKKEDRFLREGDKEFKEYIVPNYILTFNKSPSQIEVTTQEGAIPTVKRITANLFEVIFHSSAGGFFGSPTIECNFKIQVY